MIHKLVKYSGLCLLALHISGLGDQRRFTEPYATAFESHLERPIFTRIYFAFLKGKAVGLCESRSGEIPIVYLDLYFWSMATPFEKEELLYHELGHCELGRRHNAYKDRQTGCPLSIMYPTVFGLEYCYLKNRKSYIMELFGKQGKRRRK